MPSTASQARSSSPNSVFTSGRRSRPQELTFCPRSVISRTPSPARRVTSARISPGRRLTSRPRTAGTMQYEQTELQPIETCTQAWKRRSRCIGSVPANSRSSPVPKRLRGASPPAPSHSARCGIVPGPEGDVDERVEVEEPLALSLGVTAADGDHLLGIGELQHLRVPEVRREPLVRLLPDRARVEDEDVGVFLRDGLPQSELLEHALDPLGVVSVHLAPERRDVVAPHGRNRNPAQALR